MSSLTPAQRRVLEAAFRLDVFGTLRGHSVPVFYEEEEYGQRRTVTAVAEALVAAGFLKRSNVPVRPYFLTFPMILTAAGRAALGITETEED